MKLVVTLFLASLALSAASLSANAQTKIYFPDFVFEIQHDPNAVSTFVCQNPSVLSSS